MDRKNKKSTIKEYAQSGKPLCNVVKNSSKWLPDITFYINSYSRLSIYLPNGDAKQIAEPKQVENFWQWLFYHQHRVGKLIDNKNIANISILTPFKGLTLYINSKFYKIHDLKAVIGGVKVLVLDENNKLIKMGNGYENEVSDVKKCKEFFELHYKPRE